MVDLRDVLAGHSGSLDQFLNVVKEGENTVIQVKTTDGANVANKVVLENVDLLATHTEQQLINDLLQRNLLD